MKSEGRTMKDELKERVHKFNSMSLPGQPMSMHMGTSYLVNDLWREVQRLRDYYKASQELLAIREEQIGELLEQRKALRALSEKWQKEAWDMVPEVYSSRNLHYKYFKLDNEAGGMVFCAEQLAAALKESEPK